MFRLCFIWLITPISDTSDTLYIYILEVRLFVKKKHMYPFGKVMKEGIHFSVPAYVCGSYSVVYLRYYVT